ncbi:hypothetical protein EC957_003134 [Mortierella hygrophila]|uniref:Transmembrane protein 198 n=1 Tax=Mortierella hygrophila TaxID=979708 RepID=A0A9P6K0N1_9FUNG|nr:hypothetical protein EC957_003134 [Mortierella hygrophila]
MTTVSGRSNDKRSNSTTTSSTRSSRPKPASRLVLVSLLLLLLALVSLTTALPTNSTLIPIGGNVPLDVGQRVKLSKLNWGLGITLILFGLIEVFYGFKLIRLSLVVTGFLSWAIAAMIIMVAIRWDLVFTTFSVKFYYFWVWLVAGVTGATLSFRYWDLGVTFSGAFGGFAIAMGIIAIANIAIDNAGRYVLLAVLILGGSAFATFFERIFIIMSTSFGGAYVFMFGVDQFAQVGYREMIVIFDFTGKTLTYHPSRDVYLMIGFSVVLAALGIFWEFWHHSTPVLIDRKAVFRIYGRPFGKRPRKLVGQKIHHHLKTTSDVYAHIIGCFCFQRWTIDDLLYDEHIPDNEVEHIVPVAPSIPTGVPCPTCTVHPEPAPVKPPAPKPSPPSSPEPKPSTPKEENSNVPEKSAPMESRSGSPLGTVVVTETYTEITDSNTESTILERQNRSRPQPSPSSGTDTKTSSTATTTTTTTTTMNSSSHTHIQHSETSSNQHSPSSPSPLTSAIPRPPIRPEPQHPLFTQNLGEHTMEMLRLVTDDTSSDNTLPPIVPLTPHHRPVTQTVWRTAVLPPPASSTASMPMDRHVFDLLEVIETSHGHGPDPSEESVPDDGVEEEEYVESEKPHAK